VANVRRERFEERDWSLIKVADDVLGQCMEAVTSVLSTIQNFTFCLPNLLQRLEARPLIILTDAANQSTLA
jgi:hypothetical protein